MRHQPVLGGHRQFSVVDRRGGIPYASGRHLLVSDKEDGYHADAWHCPWPYTGIRSVIECLCGCGNSGSRYPKVGFWRLPGKYDWLSGTGDSCNPGCIYPGISGKILPEDHAPGNLHDCCPVLQFVIGGNSGAFCTGPNWLEDWSGSFRPCFCRDYRNL